MEFKHFIGIDVSKDTLDLSIVIEGKVLLHQQIANTLKEIKSAVPKLLKKADASLGETLFCMEHTGVYNLPLLKWLQSSGAKTWLESPIRIKKSIGALRGKNDKIDSARIANYAYTNRHGIKLWKAPRVVLNKLSALLSQRSRLLDARKLLITALKEQVLFMEPEIIKSIKQHNKKPIQVLERQILDIEKEIIQTIKSDENLNRLFNLIISIDGVGFVTAAYILITTNEFINITEAKKFACYAGVAPFEYSSGSSYKGKTRVSPKANKIVKTLLHMSALSSIKMKGELQDYYKRKVAEGKNKMSIINAVRNKIVLRIFACVKHNRSFEKNYSYSLV